MKLTDDFIRHCRNIGITSDNGETVLFFQHQDETIITLSFKEILENQEIVDRLKEYNEDWQQLDSDLCDPVELAVKNKLQSILKGDKK